MSHADDLRLIKATAFGFLDSEVSDPIHWPGFESDETDTFWLEPWLSLSMESARSRDWLYRGTLSVNLFSRMPEALTYRLDQSAGLLGKLFKAARIQGVAPGVLSFMEPSTRDIGEKDGLRQFSFSVDFLVSPLNTTSSTTTTTTTTTL